MVLSLAKVTIFVQNSKIRRRMSFIVDVLQGGLLEE